MGPDTLVRIDPRKNEVTRVIDVGRGPGAIAVGGHSVWVYSHAGSSVSEIDTVTNRVRHTTKLSTVPINIGPMAGPVLAADAGGAWFVGYDFKGGHSPLTRVMSGGRGTRSYKLAGDAAAVVVADGSAWVLVNGSGSNEVLRLDLETGAVQGRAWVPSDSAQGGVDGLAVGGGFVWATESVTAILHRIDVSSGANDSRDLGEF